MIISDLYETKIECSNYNVNIDDDTVTVTVTLKDFNKNNVTGKSVTLSVDRGYFNKNGTTAISNTTTKSITATTNSNGQITATWVASEWGLCTFSANNTKIQVNVGGWKKVQDISQYSKLYVNEASKTAMAVLRWDDLSIGNTDIHYLEVNGTRVTIPEQYRPPVVVYSPVETRNRVVIWVSEAGVIGWRTTTVGTYTVKTVLTWNFA